MPQGNVLLRWNWEMRGNERWHESDNDGKFSGLLQLMSVKALGLTHSTLQSILAIAS